MSKHTLNRIIPLALMVLGLLGVTATIAFLSDNSLTPRGAIHGFLHNIEKPSNLGSTFALIDANTWITAEVHETPLEAFRTGKATATLLIRSSLPDHTLSEPEMLNRSTYLTLFKTEKLHTIWLETNITLLRVGHAWMVVEPLREEEFVRLRLRAAMWKNNADGVKFLNDAGIYKDTANYFETRKWASRLETLQALLLIATFAFVLFCLATSRAFGPWIVLILLLIVVPYAARQATKGQTAITFSQSESVLSSILRLRFNEMDQVRSSISR